MAENRCKSVLRWWNRPFIPFWALLLLLAAIGFAIVLIDALHPGSIDPFPEGIPSTHGAQPATRPGVE
jgi:hypothetical protein